MTNHHTPLPDTALDQLFRTARTFGFAKDTWLDKPVSDDQLHQIWELAKMGPTSANMSPMRVVWVRSPEAKQRLAPLLDDGNRVRTVEAPATAIVGMDMKFYDKLPLLFPHADAKSWFDSSPDDVLRTVALRNSSLQGAYLILAARALGLDCGPMSGFDNAAVDREFFAGTAVRSNFLCNIGYGNTASLFPRSPRLSFDEACAVV